MQQLPMKVPKKQDVQQRRDKKELRILKVDCKTMIQQPYLGAAFDKANVCS